MLSKKLTFSLTFLVMLLAFGLAFAPSVEAHDNKTATANEFNVRISAAETMVDVSTDDGLQINSGRNRSTTRAITPGTAIHLLITTDVVVNLSLPEGGQTDATIEERAAELDVTDLVIDAYDAEGRALGILDHGTESDTGVKLSHRDPSNPGKEFLVEINATQLQAAYTTTRGGGTRLEIHTLLFSIGAGSMQDARREEVIKQRQGTHFPHSNKISGTADKESEQVFQVQLVDVEEGSAKYNSGTGTTVVPAGTPGVVAIQSLRERRGFIETGDFQVRIILTEEPGMIADFLTDPTKLIAVKNGKATGLTKGTTLKGAHEAGGSGATLVRAAQTSELSADMVSFYAMGAPNTVVTTAANLPEATGRDNKYHQYFATISPNPGLSNADVVISVKQFGDKEDPVAKQYVPLTPQQVVGTTVNVNTEARNARVKNEMLTVKATTTAAVDVFKPAADHLGANPQLKALPEKAVIPPNGYLVLAYGKTDSAPISGVVSVSAKDADKKTAASKDYNVHYDYKLPYPADDLDNFFRNGGTLQLLYTDIPGNTAGADGDKGYDGATTGAVAAGAVIINEIMWGLDSGTVNGQYIELHNTTGSEIGIDKNEWVIAVGSATDTHFTTVVDTAGNNPASDYWQVPGESGVTKVNAEYPALIDLVSMSRIPGTTDGTAAASWAKSMRPSANLSGRRIGTPGAANSYVKPAEPTPDPEPEPPTPAPVASPGDIKITEIMVPSNSGRLAQWVELTNMSASEVRLTGWKLVVQNDPADTEVVGSAVTLDLGDVVVGVDKKGRKQSVLVVSKAGRSSGVGTGADAKGMLREERIINVQSQASPDDAKYSLISEMGFTLTLVAPPSVGVRTDADVVGNLLKGWELPMSEGNRSSIIRREGDMGEISGTDAAGWVLASETSLIGAYVGTYYGDKDDVGTPGYDAAGALPVELSKFGAKRDPLTGQVVVTWETQSELNNAGFYIKRAEHKTAQFVPVNPTMIPGAGTTSEKQSYTYTDTTAKPNIVYYYQIEDVSLDGNRQTLTRAHRLKGHIGAAGKLTTMWGELKEHE